MAMEIAPQWAVSIGCRGGAAKRRNMRNRMLRIAHDSDGQDLVEYAMLASLIAIVAIAGMTLIGGRLVALFNAVAGAL